MIRHGLFIGKFYPPHIGHHSAIRAAAAQCDRLTVLAMAAAVETVPLADRMAWLTAEHRHEPNVLVAGIHCDAPVDITERTVWAAQVAAMRAGLRAAGAPTEVDAVFCGDDYGPALAQWFGAANVPIVRTDVNATSIRHDLAGHWDWLAPHTRAGMTTRVVIVGAESTGTTTISTRLAQHYRRIWPTTRWVSEYGREYTAEKWRRHPGVPITEIPWSTDDFDHVAAEQSRREEAAAASGSPVLICDTDAFATGIWERRYLGEQARTDQHWTDVAPRGVYLLTDHVDVPWQDDGMREGELAVRAAMTNWFADALTAAGHSWVLLTGTVEQRISLATRTIDQLLTLRSTFGQPLSGPGFGRTPCR